MANTVPDGAAQVFSEVTRFSALDQDGFPAAGSNTFTTDSLLKATLTPNKQTGVDLVTINANGDIASHFKHGDMPKYYEVTVELANPDPVITQMFMGGTLLSDSSTGIAAAPTGLTGASATGGVLVPGTFDYRVSACNQYGETIPSSPETAVTITGTAVSLTCASVTGAVYYRWYGRTSGLEQLIGQTTGPAFTDTGAVVPLGHMPSVNTTTGPGSDTGFQSPSLGIVGNPYGIGIEFWGKMILGGTQVGYLPYMRWVLPSVRNFMPDARTFDASLLSNMYSGQAFENANWGSGPFGDWQFDSSKAFQYARAARTTRPTAGIAPIPAVV